MSRAVNQRENKIGQDNERNWNLPMPWWWEFEMNWSKFRTTVCLLGKDHSIQDGLEAEVCKVKKSIRRKIFFSFVDSITRPASNNDTETYIYLWSLRP